MIQARKLFLLNAWIFSVLAIIGSTSCGNKKHYKSPPGYELDKGQKIALPAELDEISGIVYYAKDNSIFAESDEKAIIYKIPLEKTGHIKRWKLDRKRDYEDMVLLDSTFYLLVSNGNLFAYRYSGNDSFLKNEYKFPPAGNNEFETLYYDSSLHKLVMICKDCKGDVKDNTGSYAFDPVKQEFAQAFTIDTKNIHDQVKEGTKKFKPSAAAIHPLTGDLYIVASVNKLLVIADKAGNIKSSYLLDPKIFKQPEGLTFDNQGNLFISNESGGSGSANILIYPYNKAKPK
jgi:uncharacterized protein YjiK